MPAHVSTKPASDPRKDADREAKSEKPQKDTAQKPVKFTDYASI